MIFKTWSNFDNEICLIEDEKRKLFPKSNRYSCSYNISSSASSVRIPCILLMDVMLVINLFTALGEHARFNQNELGRLRSEYTPANSIVINQKSGLILWCVRILNPMKALDAKDTYARFFLNSIKEKLSYCPDTSHACAAGLIRKCKKKSENIHILEFGKIWNGYHMCH